MFLTLAAVNHPLLSAGRLDLVAEHYAKGLKDFPHVERFFIWEDLTDRVVPGEVIFLGAQPNAPHIERVDLKVRGRSVPGFYRDSAVGRVVYDAARAKSKSQLAYAAVEENFGGARSDVMLRMLWVDANRDRLFAILGFIVNHEAFKTQAFPEIYRRRLAPLLKGDPHLVMRLLDEAGQPVFSSGEAISSVTARSSFLLQFYPGDELENRMSSVVPQRRWSVLVSPSASSVASLASWSGGQAYWLSGLSIGAHRRRALLRGQGQQARRPARAHAVRLHLARVAPAEDATVSFERGHRDRGDGSRSLARKAVAVSRDHAH